MRQAVMENETRASSKTKHHDHLEFVQGQINFAQRAADENAPGIALSMQDMPMLPYDVTIRDARPIVSELSLDRQGFTLIQHKISHANDGDRDIGYDKYLEEMVPFIKNYFNASWVVPRRQGVVVRSAKALRGVREPSVMAHIDYAPIAGPMLAAVEDRSQDIPIRSYSRLMIVQAWHALSPPPQDFPLAFCDGGSVHDTDIAVVDYTYLGFTFKSCAVHFNPAHRWYYFPEMTANEFILFKGYDSEPHCNPKAAHSAFDNRRKHPNAEPRESIEARFFVYYA